MIRLHSWPNRFSLWGLVLLLLLPLMPALGQDQARSFLEIANARLQDGDYHEALQTLNTGLERFPGDSGLEALVTLVEVQRDDEKRRLVKQGLDTFFERPGLSCRTWMRLLKIDPEDKDAARNVQVLSEKLEGDLERLQSEAETRLEQSDYTGARRAVRELEDFECLYSRSHGLNQKIDGAFQTWMIAQLTTFEGDIKDHQCSLAKPGLESLVGQPMLSRQQVARAYLLIGVCEFQAGRKDLAEGPIRHALNFDPEISAPTWLPEAFQLFVEELR